MVAEVASVVTAEPRYWHGGAPGLAVGDLITPRPAGDDAHLIDGCATCEARRAAKPLATDHLDPTRVYISTDREYARLYAAGYPRGGLYQVEPIGDMVETTGIDDPLPSWAVPTARVLAVYDPVVVLTAKQARGLARKALRAARAGD